MAVSRKIFGELAEIIVEGGAKKATKYFSPKQVVKATKVGKTRSDRQVHILFTIGVPNYEERAFIKKVKKAGERFPVKKIQIKFPPKKK